MPQSADEDGFILAGAVFAGEALDVSSVILEVSSGLFDEDDLVRLEEAYGRT